MRPIVRPAEGAAVGRMAAGRGLRHLRMALWDDWVFRPLRRAGISRLARRDQRLCLWTPRFGQHTVRWQECASRNFSSGQGVDSQPYCMYGKKPHRRHGGKGPARTADIRAGGGPYKKKIE